MKRFTLLSTLMFFLCFSWQGQAQVPCGQTQVSNNFENGLFIEEGGQLVANDFIVNGSTINFSVESITANLIAQGGIATVDILFFQDNAGLPGTQIGTTIQDVVPTSQNIIGTAFGFDVHEVVIDLPTPVDFVGSGTAADTTYWVQIVAVPNTAGTQVGWEVTTASIIGNPTVFDNATGVWGYSTGNDGVFTIEGICTYVACPEPTNLSITNINTTSADLSWDPVANASLGYEWFVFAAGADPTVDTPVATGTTPAGTTTAQATSLTDNTAYDFYVKSDCDADGMSYLAGPVPFTTLAVPPANDNLADAIPLTLDTPCSGDAYTNVGATVQTGEPIGDCHFSGDEAQTTVWFTFVAPSDGVATVSTDISPGEMGDSQLTIYEAPTDVNDVSTLGTQVGCDEDSGETIILMSIANLTGLTPGDTYYIQVDGYSGAEGGFCIEVTGNAGIEDQVFEGFSYYPNPVSSELSLKATSEIEQVILYDLLGQEVLKTQPDSLSPTLKLGNLQSGAYLMKVTINGTEGTYRIVKE